MEDESNRSRYRKKFASLGNRNNNDTNSDNVKEKESFQIQSPESKKQEYMEELKAQIKQKEEERKKAKEQERTTAAHEIRDLMQSTNSISDSKKAALRDELLAQIEEKKS